MTVRSPLHQLSAGTDLVSGVGEDAELHQRRPVSAPPVADEHLWGSEASMVEVGRVSAWRLVQQLVVVGDILAQAGEDDGDVSDGVLIVAGFEVDLDTGLL